MRRLRNKVGVGVLALVGAVTPATAQGASSASPALVRSMRPIIVLESYVGQRPEDIDVVIEPLLDELDARGFAVRPAAVLRRVGGRAPRPGVLDKDKTAAAITQLAEIGFAAYTRGKFADAERLLRVALDQVRRNPALLVLDTTNLNTTFKILAGLALSQAKLGDTVGSAATMVELIRTFRTQPITRGEYGPDAEQLYRAVSKQVQVMGRGQLAITVENEQAVIFVDGQIRGIGKAVLTDLIPGAYRVFVQVPPTAGRQYLVEISENHQAVLHVDWDLDSSLWMSELWVGFVFTTDAERTTQAELAGRLSRRWVSGDPIAVVGLVRVHGNPGISGSLYDIAGNVLRSAVVTLDGSPAPKLRLLGKFLAEGIAGEGVSVAQDIMSGAGRLPSPAGSRSWLGPQLLIGVGAAALVAGGVLYAVDQDPGSTTPRYFRDTAPTGVVVGAAGIVAVGVGLWWWYARRGRGSTPTVTFGHAGGVIGWAGEL